MQFNTSILAAILAISATMVNALGVNCRGNSLCGGTLDCSLGQLVTQMNEIDDATTFAPGEHITCCGDASVSSGICLFTQKTDMTVAAGDLKALVQGIAAHGCGKCGSFPFSGNDVNNGEVTSNWVSSK